MGLRLRRLLVKIGDLAEACGRKPETIRLLAVSKTLPSTVIEQAYQVGQLIFGENRMQEAETKIANVRLSGIQWHLIGHLQSNKARRAAELFDVIQTLDSERLALRLDRHCHRLGKCLSVFIQVNIGREPQKYGVSPDQVFQMVNRVDSLETLNLRGLMIIPPYHSEAERSRPYFRQVVDLLGEINRNRCHPLSELSMGMSHDYRIAIEEGSTMLRIGTIIFGPRSSD